MERQLKLTDSAIIDLLGGTNKVAKMCKVASTAVTQWRKNGIPVERFMFLGARIEKESHGLVSRKDLFPNNYFLIWPELLKNNIFGLQQEVEEE
jgi:DNA-binding transcriptional regulator YdaS (Cro superfamily)